MLDVVIIADFCGAFDGNENNRFQYIAGMLVKEGHNVEIVTSNFNHGAKRLFKPIVTEFKGITITMLPEKPYKKNISVKRFISHYFWGKNVYRYLNQRKKPDVVYCAIPTLKSASLAGKYCKKNGVKFIVDIQDLWPEAYKMAFNVPVLSSILFAPFKWIADSAYKKADEIVAVSQTYVDRAMKKNAKAGGHSVFLGTDLEQFDKNVSEVKLTEKQTGEIWLGYYGTRAKSSDLRIIFDAMRILNNRKLKFIIVSEELERKEFEEFSKGLDVLFVKESSCRCASQILSECDIIVDPIIYSSNQSTKEQSNLAIVGRPVINTCDNEECRSLVDRFQMGFNIANDNVKSFANSLSLLISDFDKATEMGNNSRKCKKYLLDRDYSIIETIDSNKETNEKGLLITLSNGQTYYKPIGDFWIGYCGSLSDSYDIKLAIDAIKMTNAPNIQFVCMGDGYLRNEFESYGKQNGINQLFTGKLEYPSMCQLLSCVDVVINPIKGASAASIINKHADYAACGKPVINTQQSVEYMRLLKDFNCGYSFKSNQVKDISNAISALSKNPTECAKLGANGRSLAVRFFDRTKIYQRIVSVVKK